MDPNETDHPEPPQRSAPAICIAIEVRSDMARDVVITINGVPIVGGVDDEP